MCLATACGGPLISVSTGLFGSSSSPFCRPNVQLEWPAAAARHAQLLSASAAADAKLWAVTGHSTPNLADVGGASVRLRHLGGEGNFLPDGGYLLGIRVAREGRGTEGGWLAAIAGVPGDRGPDDHGNYRHGLAELMVFGRPLDPDGVAGPAVTTLHEEALAQLMPVGSHVHAVVLERVTDFFLGLNAGQWLKIRLGQISEASLDFLGKQQQQQQQLGDRRLVVGSPGCAHAELLEGTGLDLVDGVEPPPRDQRHKFEVGTSFVRTVDDWSRARVD